MKIRMLLPTLLALAFAAPAPAIQVFATVPEWGALAEALGVPAGDIYTATTALQNVHRIQARPSLIARYRQADLLIATGADLEVGWLPALHEKGNNPRVAPGAPGHFEASGFVTMLEIPQVIDRSMGDVHPYGNPHIQTDPRNFLAVAGPLAERLATLDPERAEHYRARHADFARRWRESIARWESLARPLAGIGVVTSHRDSVYLFSWLQIREIATLEPKPGIPPSAGHLEKVLTGLKQSPARMVLRAAYQDARPGEWIAQRTGLPLVVLPFTVGGASDATDLFGLFDATLARLLKAAGA